MSMDFEKDLERVLGEIEEDSAQAESARTGIAWSKAYRALFGEVELGIPAETIQPRIERTSYTEDTEIDSVRQIYDLLHIVREPSPKESRVLQERGVVFLPVDRLSYVQLVDEDPSYFWDQELAIFKRISNGEINNVPGSLGYAFPVATMIGLNPTELALPDSFSKPKVAQLRMIGDYSRFLQAQFPDARAIMLPVTGYAQADKAYKEATGEVLFKNCFARELGWSFSGGSDPGAGRSEATRPFRSFNWPAGYGAANVGAVPAIVFVDSAKLPSR